MAIKTHLFIMWNSRPEKILGFGFGCSRQKTDNRRHSSVGYPITDRTQNGLRRPTLTTVGTTGSTAFSLGYNRYRGLHLDLQRVTRFRLFRHGGSAKSMYSGAPPPLTASKLLDHPRGTACSARNYLAVPNLRPLRRGLVHIRNAVYPWCCKD